MVIHISLIGKNPEHILDGLKELIPAEKLYLLHSPNTPKESFGNIAKKIKQQIEKNFCETVLVQINAFDMMNIWNIIDKIVTDEMNMDTFLSPRDFGINVTGGTNMMAAAATVAATLIGCRAYYVHDRRTDKARKKYVEELPIPPINIIRSLGRSHQEILKTIADSSFEFKGDKQMGLVRNKLLQQKLNLKTSTLNSAIKELKKRGYIDTKKGVPVIRTKRSGLDDKPVEYEDVLENEMLVSITQLGLIQAKKATYRDQPR